MDETVVSILKILALGGLGEADSSLYCLYCYGNFYLHEELPGLTSHEQECIITKARQILAQQGMPIKLYLIYFSNPSAYRVEWDQKQTYGLAFSEEALRSEWNMHRETRVGEIVFVRDITGEQS